ncbi:zinc finger BED domain-containing protein RICESLEEPER 2-like [Asparagus officinalis]|uniref:zinc finger BED domain-containing protein RICESLEEPER 2-like n=1 Tax=Asparagus officinalis TaxID=4686 RepID=UPI00098E238D|nr:zinc finger BED domain-containing protein RICESLEEPER 2-like [Asparagus officinalis]
MSLNEFTACDDGSESGNETISIRKRRAKSKVWEYFTELPVDSDGKAKVQCKKCDQVYVSGYGTTNMLRHIHSCPKRDIDEADSSWKTMPLDQDNYREMLARVIALHGYSFCFVEHRGIHKLHTFLNPEVKHISRNTTKADLLKLYQKEKRILKQTLKLVPSRISLTTDLWTSSTSDYYMSLTAHYIDEQWILQNKILALSHVSPPYSGAILVEKLFHLLKEWGIEKRIFTVTLDNASYNDAFMKILKDHPALKEHFVSNGEFLHVRCCAHILNLVVQDGLKIIDKSLSKFRECIKYVKSPPGRKKKFAECIEQTCSVSAKKIQQDVSNRWNSTFLMLESVLPFRRAFEQLKVIDSNFTFCPSTEEWVKAEKIAKFLKPFYEVCTLFSGSKYPTSNLYFGGVWKIQKCIKEEMTSEDEDIKSMASDMEKKFNKYWKCYSKILSFACILDPRYKVKYVEFCFQKVGLGSTHVVTLLDKLKLLYKEYERASNDICMAGSSSEEAFGDVRDDEMLEFEQFESQVVSVSRTKSELEEYLDEKILSWKKNEKLNVLEYWKVESEKRPQLSMMARDILSIPITSVASESAFSIAGRVLDKYRNRLLPENAEAQICLGSWLEEVPSLEDIEEGHLLVHDFSDIQNFESEGGW